MSRACLHSVFKYEYWAGWLAFGRGCTASAEGWLVSSCLVTVAGWWSCGRPQTPFEPAGPLVHLLRHCGTHTPQSKAHERKLKEDQIYTTIWWQIVSLAFFTLTCRATSKCFGARF
jgi:hypothetical protein